MQISIVAIVCHMIAAAPSDVCHEELIMKTETDGSSILACSNQAAIAEWKMNSKFAGNQWWIKRIKCVPGSYVLKDVI